MESVLMVGTIVLVINVVIEWGKGVKRMRKIIFAGIIGFAPSVLMAITPSALIEGKIVFAISTVGGRAAYTQAQKDALIADQGGAVVNLTPTFYELAVSTNISQWQNYSEFVDLLTSKAALTDRVLDLESDLLAYTDLQTRYPTVNVTPRVNKLKAQIDLLVGIFLSLP